MATDHKRKSSAENEDSPPSKQPRVLSVGTNTSEPIQVTILTEDTKVLQGSSLILTCTFNGDSSPSAVLWTRSNRGPEEDVQLTPDKYSGGTVDNPSLTVHHVKAEDSGVYVCKLTFDGDQVSSNPLTINVEPINVTISSEETTVLQGSSLILTCTFNGESTPSAVLWTRYRESGEDIQLTTDKYSGGIVDNPSLTVHHVKAEDSGVYVCKLTFEGDQVSSNPLTINVDTTSAVLSEETNYLRIYLLCLNIGTDSVRHYFDSHVPPSSLHGHLSTHEHNLRYTQPMKCNKDQLNLLFPAKPMLPVSSTFDFSLLYKLIRNTLIVPLPARGWGFPPQASDISDEDDVERIRKYRNLLAHIEHCKIEQSVFSTMWTELSQAIQRLSKGSLTTEVNNLEHKRLDQDIRSQMVEDILQFRKEVKDLQQEVEDIIKSQKDQQARIESLEARPVPQHIPKHIRDGQITQLDAWAAEDLVFYSGTAAVKEVTDKVNQHQIVTIIGGPGAGKTSIARHIALEYQKQKFEVLPICQLEDIIQFGDKSVSQVFVLDDVLGVFSFDVSLYNKFNNIKTSILSAIGKQSRLICTCRTLVYNQANKVGSFVLENVIDVESKSNQLTVLDKINIFKNHCTNKNVKEQFDNLSFENCNFMFPLLCRIFVASDKHFKNPKAFFDHPVDCVKDELDKMAEMKRTQYAVLVLCMMNSKKISCMNKPLTSINKDLINDIFDSCSDCANPTNSQINQALQHLSGTYLTISGDHYTFIHDSIYEIVAFHFGKQHVELMIEYMPSTFVRNKLVISGTKSVDQLSIEVTENMYPLLADRLLKDIKDGKLYDVFTNPALSHGHFVDVFMDILKNQLSYQQFKEMFLTVMKGDTDHITQQSEKMAVNKEEGTRNYDEQERQNLLLGQYYYTKYSIRIISFIIYYGHSHLLQSIIGYALSELDIMTSVIGSDLSEQSRLLNLAVYSGNVDVLHVLLKYTESNAVNVSAFGDGMNPYINYHRKHTPLTAACNVGNMSAVKILLEMNGIVNPENKPYYIPLVEAAKKGHLDIVIHLVNHGGDVNLCTEDNESPLYTAARGGHLDIVSFLVEHGGDVNLCTKYNESPLYAAARGGHLDVVSFLVNHGGDVNLCTKYNESPLYTAAGEGHLDIVSFLVNHGGDVNLCTEDNRSPLYTAARGGHLDIVSVLVEHGGDVNLCSKYFGSPLFIAARRGHLDIVSFLVNHGGDVNLCTEDNESPLYIAAMEGHLDIVIHLVNHGGDVNLCTIRNESPLYTAAGEGHVDIVSFLVNHGGDVNLCDEDNRSPLYTAAGEGHLDIASFLVNHGGDVNLCTKYDESPLYTAARGGHLDIVSCLVEHGGDVNLCTKYDNESPLYTAAMGGHLDIVSFMVEHGGDVNLCTKYNESPLFIAAWLGHLDIVSFMVNHGGDVNLCTKYNNESPLYTAARGGHLHIVSFLVNHGGDVNLCDKDNRSPLYTAAGKGHLHIVSFLVNHGGDVNLCDKDNRSPLYTASLYGRYDIVKFLLKNGAKVNHGKSPIDVARRARHEDIVELLQKYQYVN